MKRNYFSNEVIQLIKSIPKGKVATYGQLAAFAGNPSGARQVARILHSCSRKEELPWQRVVNRNGQISLRPGNGYETQKQILQQEGVSFDNDDKINFDRYLWAPLSE